MNPKDSPTASERAEGPADERTKFEARYRYRDKRLDPDSEIGAYLDDITNAMWIGWEDRSRLAAATPVVPPSDWAEPQIRHLVEDIVVGIDDQGLTRYCVGEGKGLLFSNLVSACKSRLAASPSPRTPEPPTASASPES